MGLLDILWREAPISERMINTCLIKEELSCNPIDVSQEELQEGMDALRRGHRLYTPDDTTRWMRQHGTTQATLERMVSEHLATELLRKRIVAGQIAEYVASHIRDFDIAHIARIEFMELSSALAFRARLSPGTGSFMSEMQKSVPVGQRQGEMQLRDDQALRCRP